ncbi:shikimate dehydrogenase [Lysinibacillus sp. BW-2-10]|uniref:shikimate dehydrogenase n=1 Tax=Lysinibacillus sp. BW-2-10 TaxID=2590030 RepID=UPI0011810F47|nr:shikimate dehydrogenase [Lysinibacillus sp. BW-2-10]TSI08316.1 shikimate dehydrogenase [Lysinibacillus sp. BW-2-10]
MIDINIYGILGNPLDHSLSPLLQNETYKKNSIDAQFQKFQVQEEHFENEILKLKAQSVEGLIVTIPYKERIIPYLDELDITAKNTGVVNIVHNIDGKYVGFNFDGKAWLSGLLQHFHLQNLDNKNVLIIGFGGAAKSIYFELLQFNNINIDIANRKIEKVKNSIDTYNRIFTLDEAEKRMSEYDLVIQTTPIGMWPKINESPVKFSNIKQGAIFSDIIYNPPSTAFLKNASQLGGQVQNGLSMLIQQNHKAIKMWFQKEVNYEEMQNLIKKID